MFLTVGGKPRVKTPVISAQADIEPTINEALEEEKITLIIIKIIFLGGEKFSTC